MEGRLRRTERHEVIRQYLERLGRQRAAVGWIDDAQWGLDSLRFAHHLLDRGGRVRLLLTIRDEELADRHSERRCLAALLRRPGAEAIELGGLSARQQGLLLDGLLGLEPPLRALLIQRAAGNPLFAVQLVNDWIDRGVLRAGERGFALEPGTLIEIPESLHEIWRDRVARLLAGREVWRRPLQLAALLGRDVESADWRAACEIAGVPAPSRLIEEMLRQRLAVGSTEVWGFAHSMLRESLERSAVEDGGAEALHRACGVALRARGASPERVGWHLLGGGEALAAAKPLLDGARARRENGDHGGASRLLDAREAGLRAAALDPGDRRWGKGWMARAALHRSRGDFEQTGVWLERVLSWAREHGHREMEIRARLEEGGRLRGLGRGEEARRHVQLARSLSKDSHLPVLQALSLYHAGIDAQERGDLVAAVSALEETLILDADGAWAAEAREALVIFYLRLRRFGDARSHLEVARARAVAWGARAGIANVEMLAGEVALYAMEFDAAAERYRAAWSIMVPLGHYNAPLARASLGLALALSDAIDEARLHLEAALDAAQTPQQSIVARAGLMVCDVDDEGWGEHVAAVESAEGSTPDLALIGERAASRASALGWPDRASRARRLARRQRSWLRPPPRPWRPVTLRGRTPITKARRSDGDVG